MAALAEAPLRRRALERKGMTPEEELDLLIREQGADDTFFVGPQDGTVSLDVDVFGFSLGNLIGVDDDGSVILFKLRRGGSGGSAVSLGGGNALCDPRSVQHGTIYSYRRLNCRCAKCRAAQATAVREYRHRKNG